MFGSLGGNLIHLYMLKLFWEKHDRFRVTFDKEDAKSLLKDERMIPCYCPTNRSIKGLLINSRPASGRDSVKKKLISSSGVTVVVLSFWIGKLFGAKTMYIEVFYRVDKSTLSEKMVYPVADKFIVEWEKMKKSILRLLIWGVYFDDNCYYGHA